jgi:hypothetical protein
MFVILFPVIGSLILLSLLWGPTTLVVLKKRRNSADSIAGTIAFWFIAELVVATARAFIADRLGLLNPAGYVLAIVFFVGGSGALATYRLSPPPPRTHGK